ERVLQAFGRELIVWAVLRDPEAPPTFVYEGPLARLPRNVLARTSTPTLRLQNRLVNRTDDALARTVLARLPDALDDVDRLIAAGTIGGGAPNAADFQVTPQLRLLMNLDDLRPIIEARPAGQLAMRVCPHYPGRVRPVLTPA